ncbi:MAG: NAD(P)-dependent oxidoreductase [Firmicutes bacterium]|nr:NAD(P)-dependent oxidoreductase [Bacillota bacterium]
MEYTVGFLGFGEAASEFASGFREERWTGRMVAYDPKASVPPYGERIAERARRANVELLAAAAEVGRVADIVFSANSAAVAVEVANGVAPSLRRGVLYADINATSPKTKEEAARSVEAHGGVFVDVAVMGPVPIGRHKTPLLLSGPGAERFLEVFGPFGVRAKVVGDRPGMASAIKMIRSVYMKGLAMLLYESLEAAYRCGVTDTVVESIGETMYEVPFPQLVRRLVCGTAVHAKRRTAEMDEVLETLKALGSPSSMAAATRQSLDRLVQLGLPERYGGRTPGEVAEVLEALVELEAAGRPRTS